MRRLIRNVLAITMDQELGDLHGVDILIEDDRITAIGPQLDVSEVAEIIDGRGFIAIPGFVDAHRHSWQTTIRGLNSDMFFYEYVTTLNPRYGAAHRPQDKYAGVHLGALDALDAGVTTLVEYGIAVESPDDSDAMIDALQDAGVRAMYCHGVASDWHRWWTDSALPHPMDDARRLARDRFSSRGGLIDLGIALRGPEFTTPETNRRDFQEARDLGLRITLHIKSAGAIEAMKSYLGPDTCYVHCCESTDDELKMIRDSGGHVNVTPECEMGMHAPPVTHRLFKLGMVPSLGVDGAGTVSADMFVQMRMAYQELRMQILREGIEREGKPPFKCPVTTRDALRWGTLEGARQFGLDDRIGSLTPGKQADIVLLRTDGMNMTPLNHPVAATVMNASVRDVDTVLVAGKVVKRGGALVSADVERAKRLAVEARDYLYAQVGPPEFLATPSSS